MVNLFTLLLAKLFDPVAVVLCGFGGAYCRLWRQIPALALISAGLSELALSAVVITYQFSAPAFGVAVLAACIWGAIGLSIGRRLRARRLPAG